MAGNWDEVESDYRDRVGGHVAHLRSMPTAHNRNPQTVGVLLAAAETFLDVMMKLGALSSAYRFQLIDRIAAGLELATDEQSEAIERSDPVKVFLDLLRSALVSGAAHLSNPATNEEPKYASVLGWRKETTHSEGFPSLVYRAQGPGIGWIDDRGIFLDPDASLGAVQSFAARQGMGASIPWTAKTLGKRLAEAGQILSSETGRNTQKISVCNSAQRAWHLNASHVLVVASDDDRKTGRVVGFPEQMGAAS
ncbi:MAG: hypothetical protein WKF81_11640 [Thermomicrobiales bacterium]